ncbi:MAG: SDR family NAD(P)-dependent oxidoreductase [Pseudomonadota bacterium]
MAASPFDLAGKVAIVTGGNGGIGLGMARGLAAAGAAIVVAARNVEKSQAAVAELTKSGARAVFIATDVTDEKALAALTDATLEQFGRIDILVANAGTTVRKLPQTISVAEWHTVIDTNLTSTLVAAQSVYPAMKAAGSGKIITIGSMMSLFGASYSPAYAASKGGVVQLTRSLACAWAADNIQANCVLPGWIDTEMTQGARQQVEGLNERVLARTPSGRWGHTRDFAGIAVFLASNASDFVTGTAIPVDGGYSVMA